MKAFNILLDQYKQPLFLYILNMTNNQALSDDIFQETFVRFIKNVKDYKDQGNFKSWLFRIAHNLCKDHWKKKSSSEESIEAIEHFDENFSDSRNVDFIDKIEKSEDIEWLRNEVDLLPYKLKDVLLLHIYSELSFKEIALELGEPLNTILGRMHYAKKRLKERWNTYEEA